jgi:uncharacterized C2H2 Zn-finger protein
MADELFKALREGNGWNFCAENSPRCPHCGVTIDLGSNDLWEIYAEGEHDVECPKCDGAFVVSTTVATYFSTDEQEGYE